MDGALKLENQLCFPLYAASREAIKRSRPQLDAMGVTYTQYIVLLVLWEVGVCSVKELGHRLHLDSGTLTPVLKSMEQKGWLKRFRSAEDERIVLVEITDTGTALQEKATENPEKTKACFSLTDEEAETLRALLGKILDT